MICASCGHDFAEAFKFCPECGAPAAATAPAREQRKVVTVLFCDVTGSTALGERIDPEALRTLLARYFERMKAIVESHGGTVEKFIGDAVMAVFGVPTLHEDDALRAVRAAAEMRGALPELGLAGRIGVTTGEVVTGTEERLATGDPVNVAARLEQAAQPGEVLIGAETLALVRNAVEAEPVEPLALKGKAEPVPAFRLVAVTGEPARRHGAPMVGRERQRRLLDDAFAAVLDDRACHLFTILGAAGVGKSRLAAEFLDGLDAAVVRGRCLSYGDGITYSPVVEVLRQLDTAPDDEAAAAAIRVVLGESDAPTTPDQLAWAVRKTFEQAAAERPLVVVWDDLHWGDETFLDLVEHVADWSRDAPILLLCMARPELLDRRPAWAGGKLNATTVLLEPLSAEETDELIDRLADVDADLRARIREAAEGNPLFVEEMLALARESGGDVAVPPSIQALLAARLDRLDPQERAVLQRGAVEGKLFHRGAVEALSADAGEAAPRLQALVRKELVRPDRAQLPGEDAFRFRHQLIRDAAYDGLPKSERAELHERFAAWLEQRAPDLVEREEILGYHLEQAYRCGAELGAPDERLARRASGLLGDAGRRTVARFAYKAAVPLLERALALLPDGERRVELELLLANSVFLTGDAKEAAAIQAASAERAAAAGDRRDELIARIWDVQLRVMTDATPVQELMRVVDEALAEFEPADDDEGLAHAWFLRSNVALTTCRWGERIEAVERCVAHARRAGITYLERVARSNVFPAHVIGPTPVDEVLAIWHEGSAGARLDSGLDAYAGLAEAMRGRFDEARRLDAKGQAERAERGSPPDSEVSFAIELLAGDHVRAERIVRETCEQLEQAGLLAYLSSTAPRLALVLCELGRHDEADEWAEKGRLLGAPDDVITQILWRRAKAKAIAPRGELAEAERLVREAVAVVAGTDMLNEHGDALVDLGELLSAAGRADEAAAALEQAAALYARKGNLVSTQRAQGRVAELRAGAARS